MIPAIFLIYFLQNMVFAGTTQIQCDSYGNISELSDSNIGKTIFASTTKPTDEVINKYCAELNSCTQILGENLNNISDLQNIFKKINGTLPAQAGSDKMKLVSEIKRIQNHLDECRKLSKKQNPRKLKIDYPGLGPNKAIRSSNYDYENIKKIIQLSLLNGVDPFLAISISSIESPQLVNTTGVAGYEHGYGNLPIDGLPLFDRIGCAYKPKADSPYKYATSDQLAEFKKLLSIRKVANSKLSSAYSNKVNDFASYLFTQPNFSGVHSSLKNLITKDCTVDADKNSVLKKFCQTSKLREATLAYLDRSEAEQALTAFSEKMKNENPQGFLELSVKNDNNIAIAIVPPKEIKTYQLPWGGDKSYNLCTESRPYSHGQPAWMKVSQDSKGDQCCVKVDGLVEGDNVEREFLNFMAIDFIKNKIKFSKGSLDKASYEIQPFNGTGCIGCTEGLQNDCLSGLHMGTRPYYGARVADLMVNSMMANAEIRKLVAEASAELGEKVKSAFCEKNGEGRVSLDNESFYKQQRSFLLNGAEGKFRVGNQDISYKARTPSGNMAVPSSSDEIRAFNSIESERSKVCEKYFK